MRAGMSITCLLLFYKYNRQEYFLILCPHPAASVPVVLSDSGDSKPAAYRRIGVGHFKVEISPNRQWFSYPENEYNNRSRPDSPLMWEGAERVTIELA
jgi:hypothetical protein